MLVWSLFIIGHMGLFLYLKKPYNPYFGSLPTIEIIEPKSGTPIEIPALELHLGAKTKLRYTGLQLQVQGLEEPIPALLQLLGLDQVDRHKKSEVFNPVSTRDRPSIEPFSTNQTSSFLTSGFCPISSRASQADLFSASSLSSFSIF